MHGPAPVSRRMARALGRGVAALGQEALDDAVFQRMERDDRKAAAGAQHALGRFEAALEFAQFVIHIDAQRLEGARGRMDRLARRGRAHRLDTISASAAVRSIGRAATMARAMRRECRSSP